MRVLFLDFDGVLHRAGEGTEDVGPLFVWLPLLVAVLVAHPDVVVAVHSTWRYQYSVQELKQLLVGLERHVVTVVPRGPRGEAVRWFMQLNKAVTAHRILDDEAAEFGAPAPSELLVCDPKLGLTTPGVLSALQAWLEESAPNTTG